MTDKLNIAVNKVAPLADRPIAANHLPPMETSGDMGTKAVAAQMAKVA